MKQIYTALLLSSVFSSCVTRINYLGNTFTPTDKVDVYVDASAIKRPYTIVGKGYPDYVGYGGVFGSTDKLQEKVVQVARKKGADAVLFQEYYVQHDGSNFYSTSRTDSVERGVVTATRGSVTPVVSAGRYILFLKYD
jgi:hypothetical protein